MFRRRARQAKARPAPSSRRALAAAFAAIAWIPAAGAADYPLKPIRLIVGSVPGGSPDILARAIAALLGERLGQQIVVDNRPGASGIIGTELTAKAAPDGHTLLLASPTQLITLVLLKRKLPYDAERDFASVAQIAVADNVLTVHPSVPAKSVADLVQHAKAKPQALNFASAGNGTPAHLAGEMFNVMAGTRMVHVPYKGAGAALADLLAGQVQVFIGSPLVLMPHAPAGKVRPLATTGATRNPAFPDLAPVADTLPGYQLTQWWGIVAPAKTPRALIERLNSEINKVLAAAEFRERMSGQGASVTPGKPADFSAFVAAEKARYQRLVKQANLPVED